MASENMNVGEMRTRLIIESPVSADNGKGQEEDVWINVFGQNSSVPVRWRRKTTRFDSMSDSKGDGRVFALDTASVTMRYTSKVNSLCRVRRAGESGGYWYIIGSPERSQGGAWLEFTVQRRSAAL